MGLAQSPTDPKCPKNINIPVYVISTNVFLIFLLEVFLGFLE